MAFPYAYPSASGLGSGGGDGSDSGIVKLTSGTIASPVAYLDLALPAGYEEFVFSFWSVALSDPLTDKLAFALSQDDAATFLCDVDNSDTYAAMQQQHSLSAASYDRSFEGHLGESSIAFAGSAGKIFDGTFRIIPGSSDQNCRVFTDVYSWLPAVPSLTRLFSTFIVNPNATVTPAIARATTLRLQPEGFDDCDPPTSGETIAAGSYVLWGVPTP